MSTVSSFTNAYGFRVDVQTSSGTIIVQDVIASCFDTNDVWGRLANIEGNIFAKIFGEQEMENPLLLAIMNFIDSFKVS